LRELSLVVFGLLGFLVLSFNGWLFLNGQNAYTYLIELASSIPENYWSSLSERLLKSLGLLTGAGLILRPLGYWLGRACALAQAFDQVSANDESVGRFFKVLNHLITCGLWGLALLLSAGFLGLPAILIAYMTIALRIYLIVVAGLLCVRAVTVIVDSLDALSAKYSDNNRYNLFRFYGSLQPLVPLFKRCLEYGIYIFTAAQVLNQITWVSGLAGLGIPVIKVISIFFVSRMLVAVASLVIEEALVNARELSEAQRQRRMTLAPLLRSTSKYIIYFGAVIASLYALDVNPAPILAGAGIIGLTLSLGAQNLVNDIVSGFFILFENYYLVGDYIATEETEGFVEAIELRTTRIRHPDGQVQIVRNGNIDRLRNYSMEYVYAVVLVNLDYEEDLAQVYPVIEAVGRQLMAEREEILEPLEIEGIDIFEEETFALRIRAKVKPGQHLRIERILRQRIKDALDREGIMLTPREKFILEYGQVSASLDFDGSALKGLDPEAIARMKLPDTKRGEETG
ncbi:mechanosensitive ion channel protein MscS, partial [filamentous cyanobacterium CCP5]